MAGRRARQFLLVVGGLLAALVMVATPASAEDGTIAHVESTGDGLRVVEDRALSFHAHPC